MGSASHFAGSGTSSVAVSDGLCWSPAGRLVVVQALSRQVLPDRPSGDRRLNNGSTTPSLDSSWRVSPDGSQQTSVFESGPECVGYVLGVCGEVVVRLLRAPQAGGGGGR